MPVRTRRPPARRFRAPRRRTVWATKAVNSTALASGALATLDIITDLEVSGVGIVGSTVMRTHLKLSFSSTTSDTNPGFTWGLIVWDSTAGVPDPANDLEDDWFMWRNLDPGTAPNSLVVSTSILYGMEYDIRARRRLRQLHDKPFLCIHNGGSASANYSVAARTLLALP